MISYYEHTLNPPGKRPEWLRDGDDFEWSTSEGGSWTEANREERAIGYDGWGAIHSIRLRYRPKPTEQTQAPSPELVERMRVFIQLCAQLEVGDEVGTSLCEGARNLMAELEPKVDPLLIEAREIASAICKERGHKRANGKFYTIALEAARRALELAKEQK